MPLFTLRVPPRDDPCKTRGQDGVAFSFPVGLFHPLQHAGLSRRTKQTGFAPATGWLTTPSNWRRVQRFRLSVFGRGFVYAPQGCPAACDGHSRRSAWICEVAINPAASLRAEGSFPETGPPWSGNRRVAAAGTGAPRRV